MGNFARFQQMLLDKERLWRKSAIREKIGDIVVDTCYVPDVMKWETACWNEKKRETFVVEEYQEEKEARAGHKKWVKAVKDNPKIEFKEIRSGEAWFFGDG